MWLDFRTCRWFELSGISEMGKMQASLVMEATGYSEKSVQLYQTTRCYIAEDDCIHSHRCICNVNKPTF